MPEPTPGQIATQNRDISAEIISVLRSIDFAHGRLRDLVDEEEYRTMTRTRDVAMKMLQESPTILTRWLRSARICVTPPRRGRRP